MNAWVDCELPSSALPATGKMKPLRILSVLLWGGVAVTICALIFTPWQQSVQGVGRVIAYAPLERQQAIDAPISGRVQRWFVQEGDPVQKGDPIAELSDNDPEILRRLSRELTAAQTQVDAAELSLQLTEGKIASLEAERHSALENAQLKVEMAHERRRAAQRAVDAADAKLRTAELNLRRQRILEGKGLASTRALELAELEAQTAHAGLDGAKASLRSAEAEIKAQSAELKQVSSSKRATIDSTRSALEKLRADHAKAEGQLAKVEVRFSRQKQMQIHAPRDGTILRLLSKQGTEMVKQGDPLALLVPDVASQAVELYVDGNDAPLIDPDRPVRLQFEGWPAVQFVGWPAVAVGTFPGRVAFVDAHDDGAGRFRVVVVPEDPAEWPDGRYLRQGVRANGWVLLNQVSLGFELWRNFNGFPPALPEPKKEADKSATGKS